MLRLIDTHCHLDLDAFDSDRSTVLRNARRQGVSDIIIPAVTADRWQHLVDLCNNETGLHPALGLHPVFLDAHRKEELEKLPRAIEIHKPVAIGEIGLDFAIKELDKNRQMELLEQQLDIAEKARLPVILHVRKAHDTVIKLLQQRNIPGGTIHAFSGSLQQGEIYAGMGFKLGFGGMLTFERSRRLRQLAAGLPASSLVLETDAPDLVVASHQGERNSPEYLPEVLQALAAAREEPLQLVAETTTANAMTLFNLESSRYSGSA